MHVWVVSLIVFLLKGVSNLSLHVNEQASLVNALRVFFKSDCVFVDCPVASIACLLFIKNVSRIGFPSVFSLTLPVTATCARPLIVSIQLRNLSKPPLVLNGYQKPIWLIIVSRELEQIYQSIDDDSLCAWQIIVAKFEINSKMRELIDYYPCAFENRKKILPFASWSLRKGIRIADGRRSISERNPMHGRRLRLGTFFVPIMSPIVDKNSTAGFCKYLISLLSEQLKFIPEYTFGHWGSNFPNGTWTGLVGQLIDQELDLIAGPLEMSSEMQNVIHFTYPFHQYRYGLYHRALSEFQHIQWKIFLPFNVVVWFMIFAFLIIFYLYQKYTWILSIAILKDYSNSLRPSFGAVALQVFASLICQKGSNQGPPTLSYRIVHLSCYLLGIFLYICYSSFIISSLTIKDFAPLFNSFEEILASGMYQMGVFKDTSGHLIFKTSKGVLKELYDKRMAISSKNFPDNVIESHKLLCSENFIFIEEEIFIDQGLLRCQLAQLPFLFNSIEVAMAVSSQSGHLEVINRQLLNYRETGILNYIKHKLIHPIDTTSLETYSQVRFSHLLAGFFILLFGIILSLVICIIEIAMAKQIFSFHWGLGGYLRIRPLSYQANGKTL